MVKKASLLMVSCLFAFTLSAIARAELVISPTYSMINWTDNKHVYGDALIAFQDSSDGAIGVDLYYLFENNLALGGKLSYQRMDIVSGVNLNTGFPYDSRGRNYTGNANIYHMNVDAKYFFLNNEEKSTPYVMPYIGFGIGFSNVGVHSNHYESMNGYSFITEVGFVIQLNRSLGITFEYENSKFNVESDGYRLEPRHNAFTVGFSIKIN